MIMQDLLKKVLSGAHDYGDTSSAMRNKVLSIYKEALSSHCTRLVQMLQVSLMNPSSTSFILLLGVNVLLIHYTFCMFDISQ